MTHLTEDQALDTVSMGNCEGMASYIRQMQRVGEYHSEFLQRLADALDPTSEEFYVLTAKRRGGRGRPSGIDQAVDDTAVILRVRDAIADSPTKVMKQIYHEVGAGLEPPQTGAAIKKKWERRKRASGGNK